MQDDNRNLLGDPIPEENSHLIKLSGSIEHVIYENEENGYMVCDLGTDDDDLITITGTMPYVAAGDSLIVWGEWRHNPKYGRQFIVETYERYMPADSSAILRYLSSRAIKGIGPKTALKIVEEFGDNTMDVLENHPDWLSDIPGISLKKAKEISADFKAKAGIRSAMMFFRDFFGAATTVKIYKKWGAAAIDIAKKNPYRLCDEIEGIGFERADSMAQRLGVQEGSLHRLVSGVEHVLRYNAAQNGHVCLPHEKLVQASCSLLGAPRGDIEEIIEEMCAMGRLSYSEFDGVTYYYERIALESECYIAEKLDLLCRLCPAVSTADANLLIEKEELINGFTYAVMQKKAIFAALENGVMLLTGGPGTGKTTIVKALLHIFKSMGMRVALAAPTGRAAKRLSEATSEEAKTIHRLLEYDFSTEDGQRPGFRRNEYDLLEEEVIIIDESSMIDNLLMASLLRAIKPGGRLILIGDADQLPSVGAGNVLHDLLSCGAFATICLNEIFRQAEESWIVTNAHRINKGAMPRLDVKNGDFFYLNRQTDRDIAYTVADLYKNRLPRTYGADTVHKIQVITPSRKGDAGTDNLNILIQAALNPPAPYKAEHKHRERIFREGDKVMQIKNNYELDWTREDDSTGAGIFNGDMGVILRIDNQNDCMEIAFDDRHVTYDFTMLEELEHAYAITVHKSQGCEYPIVILPLYGAANMLLTRNLFYTAVTRAQKMVVLVGRAEIAERMVENGYTSERYTCLARRCREEPK